jgi:uncharacterized lipoprotein YbaY
MDQLPVDIQNIIYNYIKQLNYIKVLDEFKKNITYKMVPVTNFFTMEIKYNSHLIKKNMTIKYSQIERNKKLLHIMNILEINNEIMDYARFIPY